MHLESKSCGLIKFKYLRGETVNKLPVDFHVKVQFHEKNKRLLATHKTYLQAVIPSKGDANKY